MSENLRSLPLVYSCSGCSSAAQMANYIAIQLDRRGDAEMSCIAGVGGNIKSLVRTAQSGRSIIAIDGCPLQCVKSCLAIHDITPTNHILLNKHGVKKLQQTDFDYEEADRLVLNISNLLM
ncbi:putative zinc-binding protein [Aeromonas dhakensis]|uniref:putative zinc-binding protein n=1 Tax=Aeromonas dhakensis TaxID=196024 RepID=UPI001A8C38D3|nr:putative zinc-binding protein [Aeromonas dhakensis]QSR45206.1 putative zinc-binding protein [Aeromonas dhakensis]